MLDKQQLSRVMMRQPPLLSYEDSDRALSEYVGINGVTISLPLGLDNGELKVIHDDQRLIIELPQGRKMPVYAPYIGGTSPDLQEGLLLPDELVSHGHSWILAQKVSEYKDKYLLLKFTVFNTDDAHPAIGDFSDTYSKFRILEKKEVGLQFFPELKAFYAQRGEGIVEPGTQLAQTAGNGGKLMVEAYLYTRLDEDRIEGQPLKPKLAVAPGNVYVPAP